MIGWNRERGKIPGMSRARDKSRKAMLTAAAGGLLLSAAGTLKKVLRVDVDGWVVAGRG